MHRENGAEDAADRIDRGWVEGEAPGREPVGVGPVAPEEEAVVAADEDLDDLDASVDPDDIEDGPWGVEDLDLDLDLDLDEEEVDDETEEHEDFDDEAEMHLLHELGIDLDAPDGEAGLDLSLDLNQEEPADDGVAA